MHTTALTKTAGVVYVTIGSNAEREAEQSVSGLFSHNQWPVHYVKKVPEGPSGLTAEQEAHWAKVRMYYLSPFDLTLMLDADTRVKGDLSVGFRALQEGWDVVLVPSVPPHLGQVLWNLSGPERFDTLQELGLWCHVMYNTGVMFFGKNARTQALFQTWQIEWLKYRDRDQGALLRALDKHPVRIWLLGYPFNSRRGEVVEHLFGRARA